MKITHTAQPDWQNTDEANVIQSSDVVGMDHTVEIDATVVTSLTFTVNDDDAMVARLATLDLETEAVASVDTVVPLASPTQPGAMSPSDAIAIANLVTAVESLSGRGVRYPVHLAGVTVDQTSLQAAYETASGADGEAVDGATLIDLDTNIAYTWYATVGQWVTRGADTVSQASNTTLGVVKGDAATPGKVYVETDASLSVIGWDALSSLASGAATDVAALAARVTAIETLLAAPRTWPAAQRGKVVVLSSIDSTITPDFSAGNNFEFIAANSTLANPTNIVPGQSGVIVVTQGASGGTLAFGDLYVFADDAPPELTETIGAIDRLFYYVETSDRIFVSGGA
jgi:hypothetical protein